ncbi:hypothetical protein [Ensifer sp. 4252]|uniref:hypothetical protein n=1 Tax=Ensifer sp. 4252 TaxID=3373915 RepID=UPI003D1BBAC8
MKVSKMIERKRSDTHGNATIGTKAVEDGKRPRDVRLAFQLVPGRVVEADRFRHKGSARRAELPSASSAKASSGVPIG